MELQINSIPPGSICEGCLSVDRKLTPVYDEESRKFFVDILDPLDHIHHPLSLCWECGALIHRMVKFRTQIRHAHDCLMRYMLHQSTNLTSLSRLKTTTFHSEPLTDTIQNSFEAKETVCSNAIKESNTRNVIKLRKRREIHRKTLLNTSSDRETLLNTSSDGGILVNTSSDGGILENTSSDGGILENTLNDGKLEGDKTVPNQTLFIKMEDDEHFDDVDWCDDGTGEQVYDTDMKVVPKSDPFQYEVPVTNNIKTKKRTRRKTKMDDFDESDEEPLKLKKLKVEDKECKPRGRRKKKEDVGPKIDRRRHPAPKPEKPAGVVRSARVANKLRQLGVAGGQLEMVVLSWEEVAAERERALSSASFTRHAYGCRDCALGFNHRLKLDNHMKKHDPGSGALSCSVCRVRCRDAHALGAHRRRHRVRWRCCVCGATSSRAAVAADHFARAHGAPAPTHVCNTCGHRETTLGRLRSHLKDHAARQQCDLCHKTFRDRTSLRTHLFIHRGEKEYACPRCDKQFLFKKAMEVHLVTHDVSEQLYCYDCDMNFKNRMSYYQHMKYNLKHIDPAKLKHACSLCDKKFVKAARLEEHNMAVHLKVTPIQCTVDGCNFACSSRPVLRTHTRMVHRNARARRNHVCDTCGKAYTTKKTLEGHMRTHTGERPFHCQLCPSTFGYEAALYNHNKLVHLKAKTGRGRAAIQPAPVPAPPPAPAWSLPAAASSHIQHTDVT